MMIHDAGLMGLNESRRDWKKVPPRWKFSTSSGLGRYCAKGFKNKAEKQGPLSPAPTFSGSSSESDTQYGS